MRAPDDFDMAENGDAYTGLQQDSLVKITTEGTMVTLLGPDVEGAVVLERPTAVALRSDEKALYVVTGGGQVVEVEL